MRIDLRSDVERREIEDVRYILKEMTDEDLLCKIFSSLRVIQVQGNLDLVIALVQEIQEQQQQETPKQKAAREAVVAEAAAAAERQQRQREMAIKAITTAIENYDD